MGQHWHVWKYQDSMCQAEEKGVRVAWKRKNKPMGSIHVPVGKPITLAFWYIEANFSQNRECSYTWTFTPEAGEKYHAKLAVSPMLQCSTYLTNSTGAPVETVRPIDSCVIGMYGQRVRNGEPATINYRVKIQAY